MGSKGLNDYCIWRNKAIDTALSAAALFSALNWESTLSVRTLVTGGGGRAEALDHVRAQPRIQSIIEASSSTLRRACRRTRTRSDLSASTMAGWLPTVGSFAIPAVSLLIFFLAYTSQYLFYHLQPGPLSRDEALLFNGCVLSIWWCYDRACTVDPGRRGWVNKLTGEISSESKGSGSGGPRLEKGMRWCRKCEAVKPPRAHHCRQCGR